jgi:hypothetical protein
MPAKRANNLNNLDKPNPATVQKSRPDSQIAKCKKE